MSEPYGAGVATFQLLTYIIEKARDVKRLKKECDEIRRTATVLEEVLKSNENFLKDQETATQLNKILQDLQEFVAICREFNVINCAWEVVWKHRLPDLLKQMTTWIAILTTETTVGNTTCFRYRTNALGSCPHIQSCASWSPNRTRVKFGRK